MLMTKNGLKMVLKYLKLFEAPRTLSQGPRPGKRRTHFEWKKTSLIMGEKFYFQL
jgi:hypothetical protein